MSDMPKVTYEEKKAEAVKRLHALGILPETVRQFEKDGKISVSEPPIGGLYWVTEEDLAHIREVEKDYRCLVYFVIRSFTNFGTLDSYLFVSDYPEEWKEDWEDMEDHIICAYVYNHDDPQFSEMGSVGYYKTPAASILRRF